MIKINNKKLLFLIIVDVKWFKMFCFKLWKEFEPYKKMNYRRAFVVSGSILARNKEIWNDAAYSLLVLPFNPDRRKKERRKRYYQYFIIFAFSNITIAANIFLSRT